MRIKLTPAFVAAPPKPSKSREYFWDEGSPGLGLEVMATGHKAFVVQYRTTAGQNRRMTLPRGLNLMGARREARKVMGEVARGGDPLGAKRAQRAALAVTVDTMRAVGDEFLKREGPGMRSVGQFRSNLERHVYPVMESRPVAEIRRSEIIRLLDDVSSRAGPHMAAKVRRQLSRVFNWHANRSDEFRSPIVRLQHGVGDASRDRILSDDELRAVWNVAAAARYPFGPFIRFLLLTAVRRSEAARMGWSEVSGSDWIIPASRMKGNREHVVPLSVRSREILRDLPHIGPYVFAVSPDRPYANIHEAKAALDAASGVTGWRLHDLRRTARSLMSRAGVLPDIAERCLAHHIGGVRGIYDRYSFYAEKKAAFESLSNIIETILLSTGKSEQK